MTTLNPGGLQFLNSVDFIQNALTTVQAEISSGVRVSNASDAPDQVSPLLQLHANIQHNTQIQNNLNAVKAEVSAADTGMSSALTLMDQVQTLATQGLGLGTSADTRTTLSGQVASLLQQMVNISNTAVDGRYVFSGDNDQNPSYQYDETSATGVDRLQTSTASRKIEDPAGGTFSVGVTANQIFDVRDNTDTPTTGNVFAAINAVRVALANNDTAGLQNAQAALTDASKYLASQQTFYGNVQNRITTALNTASDNNVSLQQDLSNRRDADETQAILQMQQYTMTLQAAMSSEAKMPQTTLFDLMR